MSFILWLLAQFVDLRVLPLSSAALNSPVLYTLLEFELILKHDKSMHVFYHVYCPRSVLRLCRVPAGLLMLDYLSSNIHNRKSFDSILVYVVGDHPGLMPA